MSSFGRVPEPTFRIETSPNNETWGWKQEGDAGSPERWAELALVRAYMIERGLTDALHDATRYLRLPWGHNSKPKYKDSKNRAPAVGFTDWHPDRAVSLDEIGRVLIGGADWRQAEVPLAAQTSKDLAALGVGARPRDASMDDAIVRMAEIVGLEPRERTRGVIDAMCPNWQAHGDRAETGFSFIGSDGACFCNHASCDNMRTPDFLAMVRTQYEDHVSALIASGKNDENLSPSASGFEAGVGFKTDDETARRVVQAEAEAMASRNQRRREQAAEDHEDGLMRLASRFIWVKGAEAFFDKEERAFYSPTGIARHEAVTEIIPAGSTGKKAAANVLANRNDRTVAVGLAYVPGALETLVEVETENGIAAPHVNTWVPSRYGAVQGAPDLWLRAVEHVLHDGVYREWFLNWLAWIVQNPAGRTPIIPLLISGQGVGKDTLLRPIQQLLGTHNCTSVTTGQITGAFTEFLRKRLLILQEAKFDAGGAAYNRVKDWTGNATGWVEVNEKYRRPYRLRFTGVFIALSNDEGAVKGIDHDDRRFAPFISDAGRLDAVFSPADHAALDSADEIGRVRQFLEGRSLSGFNPHTAPNDASGSKSRIIAAGMPAAARAAYELVMNGPFAEREIIAFDEVMSAMQGVASRAAANSATWGNVQAGLAAAGCLRIRPRGADQVKISGRNVRLWTGPKASAWLTDVQAHGTAAPKKFADAYQADFDKALRALTAALPGGA
ncbi:hypothetical protein RUESEDTHA_03196 [Ruegeria sp. THAF57]|uniref:primase-helicase family protein n=1 Tax=Ruegeria sp. THAF57 TaxID=2744555 RepID=UPI0015DE1D4D|nr:primase-helicase family protein [Ruegeria sp. THAF57]CAD0186289.1 hypothetical protein RUESEDTHA_03196 [Ruegeria sp. THAF57]